MIILYAVLILIVVFFCEIKFGSNFMSLRWHTSCVKAIWRKEIYAAFEIFIGWNAFQ